MSDLGLQLARRFQPRHVLIALWRRHRALPDAGLRRLHADSARCGSSTSTTPTSPTGSPSRRWRSGRSCCSRRAIAFSAAAAQSRHPRLILAQGERRAVRALRRRGGPRPALLGEPARRQLEHLVPAIRRRSRPSSGSRWPATSRSRQRARSACSASAPSSRQPVRRGPRRRRPCLRRSASCSRWRRRLAVLRLAGGPRSRLPPGA